MTPRERANVIENAEGPKLRALILDAVKLAGSRAPFHEKAERFVDIAEKISNAITPHTPCANGCSHCCHMATAISGYEVMMIGRYVGRTPVPLHREANASWDMQNELMEKFTGVPCPFLEAGRCSVYAVRPIACRIHHSVNDTQDDCYILPPDHAHERGAIAITVPRINLTAFINVEALVFLSDDFGDIREFFP